MRGFFSTVYLNALLVMLNGRNNLDKDRYLEEVVVTDLSKIAAPGLEGQTESEQEQWSEGWVQQVRSQVSYDSLNPPSAAPSQLFVPCQYTTAKAGEVLESSTYSQISAPRSDLL